MKILAAAVLAIGEQTRASDRDCCVFARSVLRHAYGAEVVDQVAVARWHLVVPPSGPWEPVEAAVEVGIGDLVDEPTPGRWHLCQGWRGTPLGPGVTGHTFFWLAVDAWGLVFDSTRQRGQRVTGLIPWREYTSQFDEGRGVAIARLRIPRHVRGV